MLARAVNDACRFGLELTALYGFGRWGFASSQGATRYGLCAAAIVVAVTYWGVLIAPKSRRRLRDPLRLGAEAVFFSCAGAAFLRSGSAGFGIAFGVAAIVNALLVRIVGTAAP